MSGLKGGVGKRACGHRARLLPYTKKKVTKWRKALNVGPINDGTYGLMSAHGKDRVEDALPAAVAKARDPERRRRIGEARRGKPCPPHVVEAMRRGRLGKKHSEEARRKMSEAQRRRGAWPPAAGEPWTDDEDELLRTLPAPEVARRTGRTLAAVYSRRARLEVPDGWWRTGGRRG
jgi:hypothetical protein